MKLWPSRRRETVELSEGGTTPQITAFWDALTGSTGAVFSPRLLDRVWVANRCIQLSCQQIASMPLRFFGAREPAWVANPDPAWYPNGIGDAVFAAAWSMYGHGDAFLLITDHYADGSPSAWTVLDPLQMHVEAVNGRRSYRSGNIPLNPDDVVQISRDPRGGLRGTSALASYAAQCWGLIGATELGRTWDGVGGSVPNAVIKSKRRLVEGQAEAIQTQWVNARARAGVGTPAVLGPDLDLEQLAFSPSDLMLLDLQQFDARVIASAFSIPSFMLNLPLEGGLTYQNPETLFEVWWRAELRPASGRMQRALSANMLPRGSWVEFDARAALAPTFQNQVTSWLALQKEGVVTANEVRAALLHLPPIEAGEALIDLTEPPTAAASNSNGHTDLTEADLRPSVMFS